MRQSRFAALLSLVLVLVLGATTLLAQDGAPEPDPQFAGDPQYAAPDFPTGLDWVNVDAPLTLADLRGKVVVLDF